jgi:hypothetical protein
MCRLKQRAALDPATSSWQKLQLLSKPDTTGGSPASLVANGG